MLKAKLPLIILAVIVLACLGVIGYYFNQLQSEKAVSSSLQDKLDNLQKIQKDLKTKLEDSKKQAGDLDVQLKDTKAQVEALTGELETEKKSKEEALVLIDQIKAELDQESAKKADLEGKINVAQAEISKIQGQLKETQAKKIDLEAKVKDLEAKVQKVELGTINIGADGEEVMQGEASAQAAVPPAEGKILVVNKEYNFAVVNLGSKDNVIINDIFGVYSQGKYIGDVKVEKVHESMSAANFVSNGVKDKITEGDKAVFKGR